VQNISVIPGHTCQQQHVTLPHLQHGSAGQGMDSNPWNKWQYLYIYHHSLFSTKSIVANDNFGVTYQFNDGVGPKIDDYNDIQSIQIKLSISSGFFHSSL